MITWEFIISIYTTIVLLGSIILVLRKIWFSPILETKLLLVTTLLVLAAVVLSIFTSYFSTSTMLDSRSIILAKYEMTLIGIFYICMTFAFMLPNFKLSYFDILQLSIIVAINIALSFFIYYTLDLELTSNGFFRYTLPLSVAGLFVLATVVFLFYFFRRLYEVKNMRLASHTNYISIKEMIIIVIFALISLLIILVSFRFQNVKNIFELDIPGHSFLISFSFVFIISAYLINKDESYPFVVPIKLYGIILAEKDSGLTIMTKDYQNEIPTMELLGNLFTALDLSLQETIKSNKTIEDIVFGDKVVHIASGEVASAIMIVSRNSLITKSICKYIINKFEKSYSYLFKPDMPLEISQLTGFDSVFQEIRKYLAL